MVEHDVVAETLHHVIQPEDGFTDAIPRSCAMSVVFRMLVRQLDHYTMPPVCSRLRNLAVYQSLRMMNGTLSRINSTLATI